LGNSAVGVEAQGERDGFPSLWIKLGMWLGITGKSWG